MQTSKSANISSRLGSKYCCFMEGTHTSICPRRQEFSLLSCFSSDNSIDRFSRRSGIRRRLEGGRARFRESREGETSTSALRHLLPPDDFQLLSSRPFLWPTLRLSFPRACILSMGLVQPLRIHPTLSFKTQGTMTTRSFGPRATLTSLNLTFFQGCERLCDCRDQSSNGRVVCTKCKFIVTLLLATNYLCLLNQNLALKFSLSNRDVALSTHCLQPLSFGLLSPRKYLAALILIVGWVTNISDGSRAKKTK